MGSSTKEQERMALAQIREIIAGLGTDSYIGTALEGCLEIAEENIDNDFACSMKQKLESAEKELKKEVSMNEDANKKLQAMQRILETLQERLERAEEWQDYQTNELSDEDYERLKNACQDSPLDDSEAKRLIALEYGFAEDKIVILHDSRKYEVNRFRQLRYKATTERKPYHYASDWNYIRFECCGYTYESVNCSLINVTI